MTGMQPGVLTMTDFNQEEPAPATSFFRDPINRRWLASAGTTTTVLPLAGMENDWLHPERGMLTVPLVATVAWSDSLNSWAPYAFCMNPSQNNSPAVFHVAPD